MAVRLDASGDMFTRTTNLPPIGTFTIMGWFRIVTDRNAGTTFFQFGHATDSTKVYQLQTDTDGTTLVLWDGGAAPSGTNLSVGTWYHLALVCDGAGGTVANAARAYLNGVLNINASSRSGHTAAKLWIGNSIDTEWLNGRVAGIKIYDAALTAAEIAVEMYSYLPVRWANLNSWFPMLSTANDEVDFSVNARNLTVGGTLATEEGPGVKWGRARSRVTLPATAGGGPTQYNQSASGAIAPAGALVKQAGKIIVGTLTSSGSITKQSQKPLTGTASGSGALLKQAQKPLTREITSGGVLSAIKIALLSLAGSISYAGALVKQPGKVAEGTVSLAGALAKEGRKLFAGDLTSSGALSGAKQAVLALAGTITSSAAVVKQAGKSLQGYLTAILVEDAFTDTFNQELFNHAIGPTNIISAAWTVHIGAMRIAGNKVALFHLSERFNTATVDTGEANGVISALLTHDTQSSGRLIGLLFRYTDENNHWRIMLSSTSFIMQKMEAGSLSNVVFMSVSFVDATTYEVRAELEGDTIRCSIPGLAYLAAESSFNNTATRHGLRVSTDTSFAQGDMAADNWTFRGAAYGQLQKATSKGLAGSLSPAGALVKLTARALSGAISFVGAFIGAIVEVFLPPVERTYTPPADARTYTPMTESRTYTPPSDPDYTPPAG